jgi:hypothetical protein
MARRCVVNPNHTFLKKEEIRRLYSDTETFLLYGCVGTILSIFVFSKLLSIFMLLQPATLIGFGIERYQLLLCLIISLVTSFITTAIVISKLRFEVVTKC